jgi:hypothetical protein
MSADFNKVCVMAGILREHTIRATPEQNGAVERVNRHISEGATALLTEAGLPPSFWGFAVLAFIHVANMSSSHVHKGTTPYEQWHGRKPSAKRLRVFGCAAYVHLQKDQRRALEAHTHKCIFVGYPSDRPGWMFWDSRARQLVYSDSAIFDEREFPGAARQVETTDIPIDLLPDWSEQAVDAEQENDIPPPPNVPVNAQDNALDLPVLVAGHPVPPPEPANALPVPAPAAQPAAPAPVPPPRLSREVHALIDQTHYHRRPTNVPPKRTSRASNEGALVEPPTDDEDEDKDHAHLVETLPDALEHPFILHANTTTTTTHAESRPAGIPRHAWFMPKRKKPAPLAKPEFVCIPIVDGVEFALNASAEPTTLAEALQRPDGDKY